MPTGWTTLPNVGRLGVRAGRRRHARAGAHAGVRRRDAPRGPRRGGRLGPVRLRPGRQPDLRPRCTRRARSWSGATRRGGARRLGGRGRPRVQRGRRAAPRDARRARRGSASTTIPRSRSRGCSRRARSASPTSTSTCTTATASQFIFYDDPRVLTISIHEYAPVGSSPGRARSPSAAARTPRGARVNVPLPPGTGDDGWLDGVPRGRARRRCGGSRPTCW